MKPVIFFWDMQKGKTFATDVKGGQDSIVGIKARYWLDDLELKMLWV